MGKLRSGCLIGMLAVAGCATSGTAAPPPPAGGATSGQKMAFGGGDGSSCEQAVVIHARGEMAGIRAEYEWLAAKYPRCARQGQALSRCGEKPADVLTIRTADGRKLDVYFDISEYFGQF